MNEKRNSAFDNARAYIGKALKEGGHIYNSVLATIMDYGLTKSEANELIDIYGKELKHENKNASSSKLDSLMKEKERLIQQKADITERETIDREIEEEKDAIKKREKENKNVIGHKVGDEVDIETTGMASVGQKKQYNDGEGNNWWVQVTKVTKEGYIGTIVGKVGGTVNSAITTNEERRNIGKDLYGSKKNASEDWNPGLKKNIAEYYLAQAKQGKNHEQAVKETQKKFTQVPANDVTDIIMEMV